MKKRECRGKPCHSPVVAAYMQPMSPSCGANQTANHHRIMAFGRATQDCRARPSLQRADKFVD
jgi:hypothetical protein